VKFDELFRDSIGFWRIWTYVVGRRILDALPSTERELRRIAKPGPLAVWLDAAEALGLIRRGRTITLATGVKKLLVDRMDPDYLGGHLLYGAIRSLDYDAFDGFFRRGKALNHLARPRRNLAVEEATHWDHVMFLEKLPAAIRARLRAGGDVIELGCGTGAWLRRMRREFPRARFSGCDPDPETKAERGFAETWGRTSSADIVYLGEVLHLTDRPRTLANCSRLLRPGGVLLVLEGFMPERVSRRPMESMLFAMQLDQALQGVRFMRRSELVPPPGFSRPRFITLGGCVALALMTKA